ncbi:MAG: ABC-type transport auxiliary lipoprotein family protein [Xanthomonadales bacterium]|nr:ABC-type transport auxiliary lipoprotein family protein [Xanthomonadales bacterium]
MTLGNERRLDSQPPPAPARGTGRPVAPPALLLALSLAAATMLVGCTGLTGPRESFTIYELSPATPASQGASMAWQLLIETPRASDLVAGQRIIVAPDDNERRVYKGARWSERTPELLQSLWLRAFEADGRLPGVARSGSGVRADLLLASDLTRFQASYVDGQPQAEVELHAQLIDPRERRISARRVFRATVPAASAAIADVVAAFDGAMAQINPELVDWAVSEGARSLATTASDGVGSDSAGNASSRQTESLPIRRMRQQ